MTDSEPIRKYQPIRRASIAPATSAAPEAPVMVAPGAPTMESPGTFYGGPGYVAVWYEDGPECPVCGRPPCLERDGRRADMRHW